VIFVASLDGATEVPPNASTATGFATVTLGSDNHTLDVSITFSGLIGGPAAAAHIHCCATPGTNAPVVLPFTNFPAVTSGTYNNTFDISAPGVLTGISEADFIAGLEAGQAYSNIHDATFRGGEIEGFLQPVPEPLTGGIVAIALLGLSLARKRLSTR
jgi:hypothetical protein